MSSVLIFSHSITPRLQYITEFLSQYYGLQLKLVSDEERFVKATDSCKINYGYHRLDPNEIFMHSHALLFESSVRQVKVECFERSGYKAFFKTEGDFGFDLFAARLRSQQHQGAVRLRVLSRKPLRRISSSSKGHVW